MIKTSTSGMVGAVASAAQLPESDSVREVAQRAWDHFLYAWATGEWEPFLAMLTDEFTFWFPAGEFRGQFTGRQGKEQVVAWVNDIRARGQRVRAVTTHVRVGETGAVFEAASENIGGSYYRNFEAVAFEVQGQKISGFREYWHVLDPTKE